MQSSTSYLEPQEPEFTARRRACIQRDYAAHRRERSIAPCAPFTRTREVRGGLPSLGRRR